MFRAGGAVVIVVILLLAAAATAATPKQVGYPSSIAAIGDSEETGYGTNVTGEARDVKANNWVTGTNPVVHSLYARILAVNPKIKGHAYNVAGDGADAFSIAFQASELARIHVDLLVEALGWNSLCEAEPLKQFRAEIGAGMHELSLEHPDARILMVGIGAIQATWRAAGAGSVQTRSDATDSRGIGACDPKYDANGNPAPNQLALLQRQEARYNGVLSSICARYVHCRWDGALDKVSFQPSDLAAHHAGHPGPSGAAKIAAEVWGAGFDFADTSAPVSHARRSHGPVTLTATDPQGVSGIEYRLTHRGAWTHYTRPLTLLGGQTLTWRAVDVNGNVEASHALTG